MFFQSAFASNKSVSLSLSIGMQGKTISTKIDFHDFQVLMLNNLLHSSIFKLTISLSTWFYKK